MGLFSWLFGKKKEAPKQPEIPHFTPIQDLMKEAEESYKKKEAEKAERIKKAIEQVPGSEKYVLDKYQTESNAHIQTITEFTPISKKRFVVFDLETTGLNYKEDEIVEIGAVRVENGEITEEFSTLVQPKFAIPAEASAVNHITNDMLEGKPMIYEVLPSFLTFVGDDVLVAHNIKFDYRFLAQACMVSKFRVPEMLFDTMALARYYPDAENKKLTTLVECAGIECENAHRALSDARMTAKLIVATNEKRKKK